MMMDMVLMTTTMMMIHEDEASSPSLLLLATAGAQYEEVELVKLFSELVGELTGGTARL